MRHTETKTSKKENDILLSFTLCVSIDDEIVCDGIKLTSIKKKKVLSLEEVVLKAFQNGYELENLKWKQSLH